MSRLAAAGAVGAVLVLAACASSKDTPPCPSVGAVRELADLVRFRDGKSRDLTDIRFVSRVQGVSGTCRYDDAGVSSKLTVSFVGERGPAGAEGPWLFQYFVAIAAADGSILAKEVFPEHLDFGPGRDRTGVSEDIEQRIPLPAGGSGAGYHILVGYQLTADELEWNRAHPRR